MKMNAKTGAAVAATAATLFLAGIVTAPVAEAKGKAGHSMGANACKGHNACKGANKCKAGNKCKAAKKR